MDGSISGRSEAIGSREEFHVAFHDGYQVGLCIRRDYKTFQIVFFIFKIRKKGWRKNVARICIQTRFVEYELCNIIL